MRKPHLTIDELAQIALERFRPLIDEGKPETPIATLAAKWGREPNAITNAIRRAGKLKLLELKRVDRGGRSLARPVRHDGLEARLVQRYPSLGKAIVVRTFDNASSDLVHRELGYAMAAELGAHIKHGTTIGLGSGRGPYYTVMGLSTQRRLARDDITLMSLTGAVYPEAHDEALNVLLDADFHTGLLGVCFSRPLRTQRMVSYPIAPKDIAEVRRQTWLDDAQFREHTPSIAIVGVGVLRGGHRFYQAVQHKRSGSSLEPIYADLVKLVKLADQYANGTYCPVADLCNRLFAIDPPRGNPISAADRDAMRRLIARINDRLLTLSEDQLRAIGGLMLVAGTPEKALAIRALLADGETPSRRTSISVVCTDASTAEMILAEG